MNVEVAEHIEQQIERDAGVPVQLRPGEDRLIVDGVTIPYPEAPPGRPDAERWDQLNLRQAFPSRPRGDQREKLIYKLLQDAGSIEGQPKLADELRQKLPSLLGVRGPADVTVLADAMRDRYWAEPKSLPFLRPYHADLPMNFAHSRVKPNGDITETRYKLFHGGIFLLLCWNGESVDDRLLDELLQVFDSKQGFTVMDRLFHDAALALAERPSGGVAAVNLLERYPDVPEQLAEGAFCQPHLDQFQADLRTVLAMQVPRSELIDSIINLVSLHLGVYFYRVALVLGEELDRVIAATAGRPDDAPGGCDCSGGLESCALAGRIRFRTRISDYESVPLTSPCVQQYDELDRRRLLSMPATVITSNLLQHTWQALGGPESSSPRLRELVAELTAEQSPDLKRRMDGATRAIAALIRDQHDAQPDALLAAARRSPGPFALQQAVLSAHRTRLRQRSQAVVNQLLLREDGGSLLTRNGTRVTFFELDSDFLALLVKLVCRDEQIRFETFVARLARYGLAPQHASERSRLADALERLGMLNRYSDAGEAQYVKHAL